MVTAQCAETHEGRLKTHFQTASFTNPAPNDKILPFHTNHSPSDNPYPLPSGETS
ncbi:hypothetical protein [Neisseria elongata]|uniref:hypothetical protein n=1 Tax=Neisseria elongata TaxID=495 RepID=UPI00131B0283|nr:hypothetical protein [Neisseria elongata]